MFEITLKPRHPTGSYQRAGIRFNVDKPVLMEVVPEVIKKDFWLVMKKVETKQEPKKDFTTKITKEEKL